MLKFQIPNSKEEIVKLIKVLECQIKHDNKKDKLIHIKVLNRLRNALYEGGADDE